MNLKSLRTCKIKFLANFVPQRTTERPNYNGYHLSRKRRLALGLPVGRKSRRTQRATS